MTSDLSLTMNRNERDTIAAAMQLPLFFLKDSSILLRTCIVTIVVGSESGDKSDIGYNWGPQTRRFAKRDPRSSSFAKKGSAKQKVWNPLL